MDLWEGMRQAAIEVLQEGVGGETFDRARVIHALHLYAIGVNKDPHIPMPPLDILDDRQLKEMVEALLAGA